MLYCFNFLNISTNKTTKMLYCPNFLNIFIKHPKCCPNKSEKLNFSDSVKALRQVTLPNLEKSEFLGLFGHYNILGVFHENIKKIGTVQHFCCFLLKMLRKLRPYIILVVFICYIKVYWF